MSDFVNGLPKRCDYKACQKPFVDSCFHCKEDGRYYCDADCAEKAIDFRKRRDHEVN